MKAIREPGAEEALLQATLRKIGEIADPADQERDAVERLVEIYELARHVER